MGIDVNCIREDKGFDVNVVRTSETRRFRKTDTVGDVISADAHWRQAQFQVEQARKELGLVQKQITDKKKSSKGQDPCVAELAQKDKHEATILELEKVADEAAVQRDSLLHKIGNIVHDTVPVSNDEANNQMINTWGTPRILTKPKLQLGHLFHHQILRLVGAYEQDPRGLKVAGHRGYFLRGIGVLLNQALVNYGVSFLAKKGYIPLQPPFFMKKDVMASTAELGDFDDQLYKVSEYTEKRKAELGLAKDEGEYYLIATSEQPISALHKDETIEETSLPIRYAGISTCFRKEAGSHGRDTWGLFRIHQFEKVEQFVITDPESSWAMHEEMTSAAEEFLQSLDIPHRRMAIVSGALNDAASKKFDIEGWFPAYNEYRELMSCSNCTDFQSRAMNIKCGYNKQGDRQKRFVHMLNATLCASERTMCCIAENYQTEEGLRIPRVLQPYMGGIEFIPFDKNEVEKYLAEAAKASSAPVVK